jgi:drug/metabolite transporter (DMT)-like permease
MGLMRSRHVALLAVGVLAVSSSAILIRLAAVSALAISFYRCAMAAAVLLPLALVRHRDELRALARREWLVLSMSAAALGVHFALWIPSLSYTTVAASTVLVTSSPVWVALLGRLTGRERVTRLGAVGIALSMVGAIVISGGDVAVSLRAAFGDLLALGGAIAAAGYVLAGRDLRPRMSLVAYTGVVYAGAAAALAAAMAGTGTPFAGYPPRVWALFAAMTVGPQFLGHTVFNYLLAHVDASVVAISVTAEPVGASLLAFAFLGESPAATVLAGGAIILAGIYVAIAGQARAAEVLVAE